MHTVYLACLFGGLVATVLFAALGALGGLAGHGPAHVPSGHGPTAHQVGSGAPHGHAGVLAHGHGGTMHGQDSHASHAVPRTADAGAAPSGWLAALGWTLSWLSPLTIAAGALWFGGAGLVAEGLVPAGTTFLPVALAIVAALAGAALIRAVMNSFMRASTPPLHDGAEGALGMINAPIRPDGAGEVIYTLEGLRRSAPARSVDGAPLRRGTQVVIVRRERGMAWVSPIDPLTALPVQAGFRSPPGQTTARGGDLSPPP